MRGTPFTSDSGAVAGEQGQAVLRASQRTFTTRIANLFKDRPNQWIDSSELELCGGRMAWRTRVSDARRLHGMRIVNRITRNKDGVARSEYMFVPAAPEGRLF